jgi:hypothetical protein
MCGKAIAYDQIGNPLTYNGFAYTWEMGRQLKSVSVSVSGNNLNIEYKYNDVGVRTEKTVKLQVKRLKFLRAGIRLSVEEKQEKNILILQNKLILNIINIGLINRRKYYG